MEDVREYERKMNEKTNEKVGVQNTDTLPSEDTTTPEPLEGATSPPAEGDTSLPTDGTTMTPNAKTAEKTDPIDWLLNLGAETICLDKNFDRKPGPHFHEDT